MNNINRRQFMQTAALGTAAIAIGRMPAWGGELMYPMADKKEWLKPYGGFYMGIESFSLRNFDLDGCLSRAQKMGLHYIEFFSGHLPPTADEEKLAALKAKLAKVEINFPAYFAPGLGNTVASNRPTFEFAKAMRIKVIVGDPAPESFESFEKLVDEYQIRVAIHNHGLGSRYNKISDVAKALEGRHKLIGACVDTGHFIRSDEDPVKAIKTFGERTFEMHLKDADEKHRFTMLGQGTIDTVGVLRALKKIKFAGCLALEYEEKPENPVPDMEECLRVVREDVKKM
jgi:inosose dehydratase